MVVYFNELESNAEIHGLDAKQVIKGLIWILVLVNITILQVLAMVATVYQMILNSN